MSHALHTSMTEYDAADGVAVVDEWEDECPTVQIPVETVAELMAPKMAEFGVEL